MDLEHEFYTGGGETVEKTTQRGGRCQSLVTFKARLYGQGSEQPGLGKDPGGVGQDDHLHLR